jgi:NAD(P)-dependent dehydrogenase (short-subunit alcohol dehydrogenase family)
MPNSLLKRERMSSSRVGSKKLWIRPSKLIGRKVTGAQGDAANLDDLDRLFDRVKREKGGIDLLFT